MPATYKLIASNTLSTSASSVTFSAIPGTYTDLVLKYSARTDNTTPRDVRVRLSGITTSQYSSTDLRATNATASSVRSSNQVFMEFNNAIGGSDSTANTFSNNELYFPNYISSTNKPVSNFGVVESNHATDDYNYLHATAGLWRNTGAITSIELYLGSNNFVSGSSFFLYGIKNS
jgi:hypothetical protein